jgi:SAM-dependent methyltransferase
VDREGVRAFMDRFMGMVSSAATVGVVAVGDRTGLFAELQGQGPMTLEEIVDRTGLQERYVRELLSALAAADIVLYDPSRETFELPDEHAACLADERSPYFLAGWTQVIPAMLRALPGVARAAREGGGVSHAEFGEEMVEGVARSNGPGTQILLTRKWLPPMPQVVEALERGIRAADIGCGAGAAAITLARAFPNSTVVGYDVDLRSIDRARESAERAKLSNLSFERVAAESIPTEPSFDFVMSFDTIHDMVDPRAALRRIREALHPEGTYLMVEPAAGDTLQDNLNPGGALLYAMSSLHCMTVSLAHGGEGLGAAWGPRRAEELCREGGFTRFRRLDIQNPFNAFYEARP